MFWSVPCKRRVKQSAIAGEMLETRELLSATGPEVCEEAILELPVQDADPLPLSARAKEFGPLTGFWEIPTEFGTVNIESFQKGAKVKGLASLPAVETPFGDIELPDIKFKGKFNSEGVLVGKFKSKVDAPPLGLNNAKLLGNLTAEINLLTQKVTGHIHAEVDGLTVLDTDYESDLPTLPASPGEELHGPLSTARGTFPRILDYSGEYDWTGSGVLGTEGTLDLEQEGLYLSGTFNSELVTGNGAGLLDLFFTNNRGTVAKGIIQVRLDAEPLTRYWTKFQIKFFNDGGFSFKYSKKLQVVDNS